MDLLGNKNLYTNASTFCRLVEMGSFTAVAKKFLVNQSTISRRIIALEEELNSQLIRRNSRNVEITEDGHNFYKYFIDHEQKLNSTIQQFKTNKLESSLTLRVTIPLGVSNHIISPYIAKYAREHPNLILELFYQNREVDLVKEVFDLAIVRHVPKHQTLKIRKLFSGKFSAYASPKYIEQYGQPCIPQEIANHVMVGNINDRHVRDAQLIVFCPNGEQVFVENTGPIFINNLDAALRMALSGHALIGGFDALYADELASGKLVKIMPGYKFGESDFYLVRLNNNVNPALDDFIHFIEECFLLYSEG